MEEKYKEQINKLEQDHKEKNGQGGSRGAVRMPGTWVAKTITKPACVLKALVN